MTFDPFGDYTSRGYLRNTLGFDENKVKALEQKAFRAGVDAALDTLKSKSKLTYEDVLQTHAKLFSSVYPWAGQDRSITAPEIAVGKNDNFKLFAHPDDSRRAVGVALAMAENRNTMRSKPGEIMGLLAYAHPFLDGNGRTIMTVHAELCRRAGMNIDWTRTNKADYLDALTKELESPGKGHLDGYLKPLVQLAALDRAQTAEVLRTLPGLGPAEKLVPGPAPRQKRKAAPDAVEDLTPGPVIVSGRILDTTITRADLDRALEESDLFRDINRNLERMSARVYREPSEFINDVRQAAISGPIGERKVVSRIKLDPDSYGQYVGAGGIFSSQQERMDNRNAIAGRPGLVGVAGHMISVVHGIRTTLAQDRRELAERGTVAISMPNASIMQAIEKKRPISEAQSAEIDKAVRAFEHRFGMDVGRLRIARNLEPIAQKHGIDTEQLMTARQVLKTLDKGQTLAREQAQAIKPSQQASRGGPVR